MTPKPLARWDGKIDSHAAVHTDMLYVHFCRIKNIKFITEHCTDYLYPLTKLNILNNFHLKAMVFKQKLLFIYKGRTKFVTMRFAL